MRRKKGLCIYTESLVTRRCVWQHAGEVPRKHYKAVMRGLRVAAAAVPAALVGDPALVSIIFALSFVAFDCVSCDGEL